MSKKSTAAGEKKKGGGGKFVRERERGHRTDMDDTHILPSLTCCCSPGISVFGTPHSWFGQRGSVAGGAQQTPVDVHGTGLQCNGDQDEVVDHHHPIGLFLDPQKNRDDSGHDDVDGAHGLESAAEHGSGPGS